MGFVYPRSRIKNYCNPSIKSLLDTSGSSILVKYYLLEILQPYPRFFLFQLQFYINFFSFLFWFSFNIRVYNFNLGFQCPIIFCFKFSLLVSISSLSIFKVLLGIVLIFFALWLVGAFNVLFLWKTGSHEKIFRTIYDCVMQSTFGVTPKEP